MKLGELSAVLGTNETTIGYVPTLASGIVVGFTDSTRTSTLLLSPSTTPSIPSKASGLTWIMPSYSRSKIRAFVTVSSFGSTVKVVVATAL